MLLPLNCNIRWLLFLRVNAIIIKVYNAIMETFTKKNPSKSSSNESASESALSEHSFEKYEVIQ